jgi:hypothetical protein
MKTEPAARWIMGFALPAKMRSRLVPLPYSIAVLFLLGGAAPGVGWLDATGKARSQAVEEKDSSDCLMRSIESHPSDPASQATVEVVDHEFMTCMSAKKWKAILRR